MKDRKLKNDILKIFNEMIPLRKNRKIHLRDFCEETLVLGR